MASQTQQTKRIITAPYRWMLLCGAFICLGLGIIGAVVPGMPTTVFVLAAAWMAARSCPALEAWLERHPTFGPLLYNWNNGRCVPRKAKYAATAGMSLSVGIMVFSSMPNMIILPTVAVMAATLVWLWMRPEQPA